MNNFFVSVAWKGNTYFDLPTDEKTPKGMSINDIRFQDR